MAQASALLSLRHHHDATTHTGLSARPACFAERCSGLAAFGRDPLAHYAVSKLRRLRSRRIPYPWISSSEQKCVSSHGAPISYRSNWVLVLTLGFLDQARIAQIDAEKGVSPFLVDTFHRQHNYLRISLTERCNLRCAQLA